MCPGRTPLTVNDLSDVTGTTVNADGLGAVRIELGPILQQLTQSEAIFRTIAEAIDYGIWIADPRGELRYVSDSIVEALGTTFGNLSDSGWLQFLHPDDRETTAAAWRACAPSGTHWRRENRYCRKDGNYIHVLSVGRPVVDGVGSVTAWVGVNVDITDLKETEAALREVARAKNRVLAAAGHDLLQPLQVIVGAFERISHLEKREDKELWARRGLAAVTRLTSGLDSLLASSRLELGAVQPVPEDFPAHKVIEPLKDMYEEQAARKGLTFIAVTSSASIRTDPDLLLTILGNLVDNAVKYTERGRILIGCRRRGQSLSIEVLDTGIGIPPGEVGRIFDEFRQVDGQREGFGLGLSIVQRTAAVLGIEVGVYSELGRGSRFTVLVPLGSGVGA